MKSPDVQEDHIYLKEFPHSLEGVVKDWLYYLAPRSITSWDDLKRMFLEKFFPASRTTTIRKDISGIRQLGGESLYEYWERFKKLCASCPHHQISEQLLLQYFYEGLNNMERSMIDATSGGALGDMTLAEARHLIEKMASNSQQFSTRNDNAIVVRGVHDVATDADKKLETKLDALVNLVTQLAANQKYASVAWVCNICTSNDHHTDSCPPLQQPSDVHAPQAYAANIYNNRPAQQQQQNQPPFQNHPSSSSYQPPQQRPPSLAPAPLAPQPSTSEPSLEELVRQMTLQNIQFQQETRASIQSLTNQMGQMATQLNQAQSQNSDKLPSQTVQNPKNVSAITLRSGKQIEIPIAVPPPPSAPVSILVPVPASASEQKDELVGA
ncbi:uncharacterized protein LOC109790320 [Cajanus cajan]|nr:uncharacterized protein LOC109790320 [Cajanus cajan]